jgi:hypothetical protein
MSELPPRYRILRYNPSGDDFINFYMGNGDIYDLETAKQQGHKTYPEGFKIWALHHKLAKVVYEYGFDEASIQQEV